MKRDAKAYLHDMIDDATVWSAIESNLPTLLEEVKTLQDG